MAIDNKKKYIIEVKNPTKFFNYVRHLTGAASYQYRHGYLDDHTSIREIKNDAGTENEYLFTYNNKINKNLIEIKTNINEHVFKQLWVQVSKVIQKRIVKIPFNNLIWVVDFIIDNQSTDYFLIMVEVEMVESQDDTVILPSFIEDNLLYTVDSGDDRFVNIQLTNPKLINKILKELKDGKLQST